MGRSTAHRQPGPPPTSEVLIGSTSGTASEAAAIQQRRPPGIPSRAPVLNTLEHGTRCVVTTRDGQIVSGWFRGIEVPHGDQSILVESTASTHSIPVESVLTASRLERSHSRRTTRAPEEANIATDALDGHTLDGRDLTVAIAKPRSR